MLMKKEYFSELTLLWSFQFFLPRNHLSNIEHDSARADATRNMEQSCVGSRQQDESDFSLKEWALKAKISRTNTSSRRFSESNLKSFRENARSFRSNITISSTASSPGYTLKEEIDPSTYSFTTALKALQAKTMYTWEYLSPDGYTLNSKWNDAERYICNPLSGQVPLECLSTKTLSARSFRSVTSRITMSAPLIYPSPNMHPFHAKSPISEHESKIEVTSKEKIIRNTTRDVGTQSTQVDPSWSSPSPSSSPGPSPAPTPSIEERSIKLSDPDFGDSSISSDKLKSENEVEARETRDEKHTKRSGGERKKQRMMSRCSGGCLSLRCMWMRDKHNLRTNNTTT